MTDHGFEIFLGNFLVFHHVQASQDTDRQYHVHERSGRGDDQTLPAWFRQEGARVVQVLVGGLFARHLDVAAHWDQRKAVIRLTPHESEQPLPEAEAEGFHFHVEIARRPEMAQFVEIDHHPDQDQQPQYVLKESQHIASSRYYTAR